MCLRVGASIWGPFNYSFGIKSYVFRKHVFNVQKKHFKLKDQLQIKLIVAKRLVKVLEQEILDKRGLKTVRPSTSRH